MKQRVDYSFAAAPRELGGEWYACSFFERALGGEIFRLTRGEWWHGGAEWRDALCLAMSINGPERPNVKRALSRLADRGLLELDGTRLRVLFTPTPVAVRSQSGRGPVAVRSGSGPTPVPLRSSSGPTQIEPKQSGSLNSAALERVEREEERDARAQPRRERPAPERLIPLVQRITGEVAFEREISPGPEPFPSQVQTAARRAQELLDRKVFPDAESAVRALVVAAFDAVKGTKRSYGLALTDATVAPPKPEFRDTVMPWGRV